MKLALLSLATVVFFGCSNEAKPAPQQFTEASIGIFDDLLKNPPKVLDDWKPFAPRFEELVKLFNPMSHDERVDAVEKVIRDLTNGKKLTALFDIVADLFKLIGSPLALQVSSVVRPAIEALENGDVDANARKYAEHLVAFAEQGSTAVQF
jgi:hypothetical protein